MILILLRLHQNLVSRAISAVLDGFWALGSPILHPAMTLFWEPTIPVTFSVTPTASSFPLKSGLVPDKVAMELVSWMGNCPFFFWKMGLAPFWPLTNRRPSVALAAVRAPESSR